MQVADALDSEDNAGYNFKPYHPYVRAFQRRTRGVCLTNGEVNCQKSNTHGQSENDTRDDERSSTQRLDVVVVSDERAPGSVSWVGVVNRHSKKYHVHAQTEVLVGLACEQV